MNMMVHTAAGKQEYNIGDVIDVGDPLPGLRVAIADVFPS